MPKDTLGKSVAPERNPAKPAYYVRLRNHGSAQQRKEHGIGRAYMVITRESKGVPVERVLSGGKKPQWADGKRAAKR